MRTQHQDSRLHVELLRCGLQDRIVTAVFQGTAPVWQLVYLQSGRLEIWEDLEEPDSQSSAVDGPALIWHPVHRGGRLRLIAGSVGARLTVDELGMSGAIGSKPEAAELRQMAEEPVTLSLIPLPEVSAAIAEAVNVMLKEAGSGQPGNETIIEAQLRYLLVLMWRHSYRTNETLSQDAAQTVLLRRFRQLVETHFRNRWRVLDYATALGTTPDRLHNISRTALDRAPLSLIHDRTVHEAKSLLSRSNLTIDQIAGFLGFHSAAQFSKFFATQVRSSPGRYRQAIRSAHVKKQVTDPTSFKDWP